MIALEKEKTLDESISWLQNVQTAIYQDCQIL